MTEVGCCNACSWGGKIRGDVWEHSNYWVRPELRAPFACSDMRLAHIASWQRVRRPQRLQLLLQAPAPPCFCRHSPCPCPNPALPHP